MARIEIIMYVALGFATAALIAFLLGGLLWNIAVGVGRRRAQRTAPIPAVAELQAERSRLLAENAMLARRVEVRLDDLRNEAAEHMAQVARSRNRIDLLGAEIEKRDAIVSERESEIARLREQLQGLEAELATRTGHLRELQEEFVQGGQANTALGQQIAERDRHIERLSAEVERLSAARSEAVSRERSVQERLMGRIEDLTALSRQIEAQRRELVARQARSLTAREGMAGESRPDWGADSDDVETIEAATDDEQRPAGLPERLIDDAEREASELQNELNRLDEIWAAKLAEVAKAVAAEPPSSQAKPSEPLADPAHSTEAAALNGGVDLAPAPAEEEKKTASGLANVISLAQRIRALQRSRP